VSLQCGQVYQGTLDLSYKSYVTVNVAGTCGKPTIIPSSTSLNGINAVGASNIKISGIKIQGAAQGINVNNAKAISIDNVDILNSSNSGIFCSGVNGMTVSNSSISNSGVTGVDSLGAVNNATITNTTVYNTTKGSSGSGGVGIYFYNGSNNRIDHVSVSNSAYHGIVSLETPNSYVTNSLAQNSCTGPDKDCGAIYTAQKVTPHAGLNLLIDNNKVVTSGGSGIYLDDYANGVTVSYNDVSGCSNGMMLHNGYNNSIHHNKIANSAVSHVAMGQDTGTMHDNVFTYNAMNSTQGEYAYRLETGTNLSTFAQYDYNTYQSTNVSHFGRLWQGGTSPGIDASYSAWKSTYMIGQDTHSTMNGVQ
jgi:parallel beta-helix repeat protein